MLHTVLGLLKRTSAMFLHPCLNLVDYHLDSSVISAPTSFENCALFFFQKHSVFLGSKVIRIAPRFSGDCSPNA